MIRYVKTCNNYVLKYIKYPTAEREYCNAVKEMLNEADDWVITVERLYSSSEAHAVSDAKRDITILVCFLTTLIKLCLSF